MSRMSKKETFAFLISRVGKGFRIHRACHSPKISINIAGDFEDIPNDRTYTEIRKDFKAKKCCIPRIFECNLTAPSEVWQLFFVCEDDAHVLRLSQSLEKSSEGENGEKMYLSGFIYNRLKFASDIPKELWNKFAEF